MVKIPYMTPQSWLGLGLESVRGSAASVTTYTPVISPKVEPKITWLKDPNFRGSPVANYDEVPGVRSDIYSAKTFIYTDTFPQLIRACLGGTDTVASVGASLWSHTIGLYNSASLGSQPPSYTIWNDSVDNTYQCAGGQCDSLSISFSADAAVETTFQFLCNAAASVVGTNYPNESVQHIIPAWNCAASVAGVAVTAIESGSLDIKRNATAIHTLGQQAPYRNWAGPIDVSGKFAFVVESGNPYFWQTLLRQEQAFRFLFTDPFSSYSIAFNMSACQLENAVIDQSKNWISMSADLMAVGNTTDAIGGGFSPISAIVINNISTAY
jgi:hypothetical protein